jgi:predicted phosphodiesterase
MKRAAIADVHGNSAALEAVLADIATLGVRDIVNLGDHLSGRLEAQRTTDLLIARGFPSIRGDQDRVLVELGPAGASRRMDHKQLEERH